MSAPGLTIPTRFTAEGDYTSKVGKMAGVTDGLLGRLSKLSAFSNKAFSAMSPGMSGAAKNLLNYAKTAVSAIGIYEVGAFGTKSITDYETAIASLQAVTGSSDAQMVGFKKEIKEAGDVSKKSMSDIAAGFETVGSMMSKYLDDPKAMRQITNAGINLSKAARMEVQPSLEALTSIMNQFDLGADKAANTVDRLTAGEIVGQVRTAKLAEHLQNFGGAAKGMNVDLAESVSLVETLAIKMDPSKVGIGARNVLLRIGGAGGLDREARKRMRAAGVDTKYLMDNTHSLSERLHELSKISNKPIAMMKVFGDENVIAAKTIFDLLPTYDKWVGQIRNTSQTEMQAATNSKTLTIIIDQLKNKFSNLLNSSGSVSDGLQMVKNGIVYVTDNMESLIDQGVTILKFYAAWKTANIVMNVVLGAQNFILNAKNYLMETGILRTVYYATVTKAAAFSQLQLAAATDGVTASTIAMSSSISVTPLGWGLLAVVALAGGYYLLNKRSEELYDEYEKMSKLQVSDAMANEVSSVKKLVDEYRHLGLSIKDATKYSIDFEAAGIAKQRRSIDSDIQTIEKKKTDEYNKFYWRDMLMPILHPGGFDEAHKTPFAEVGDRASLAEELSAKQVQAKILAGQMTALNQYASDMKKSGILDEKFSMNPYQAQTSTKNGYDFSEKNNRDFSLSKEQIDYIKKSNENERSDQLKNQIMGQASKFGDSQKIQLTINNQSSSPVDVKTNSTTQGKSVVPAGTSTFDIKK